MATEIIPRRKPKGLTLELEEFAPRWTYPSISEPTGGYRTYGDLRLEGAFPLRQGEVINWHTQLWISIKGKAIWDWLDQFVEIEDRELISALMIEDSDGEIYGLLLGCVYYPDTPQVMSNGECPFFYGAGQYYVPFSGKVKITFIWADKNAALSHSLSNGYFQASNVLEAEVPASKGGLKTLKMLNEASVAAGGDEYVPIPKWDEFVESVTVSE